MNKKTRRPTRRKTSWFARLPKIWQVVIFVLGVPGLYVGVLSVLPRVSVAVGDVLQPSQPLSFPLSISNDGFLDVHSVRITCSIERLVNSEHAVIHNVTVSGSDGTFDVGDLGPNGRATTFCTPGAFVSERGHLTEGHVVVLLSFRPDFLPWHTSKAFYFRGTTGENDSFRWVPTSN